MVVVILGLAGLAGCDSAEDASTSKTSGQASVSTSSTVSASTAGTEPSRVESLVVDGVWGVRIDRMGGSEDPEEAFGVLPEARYQPIENGPTYRVVISEQGSRASVEGTRGTTQVAVRGKRTSTTDEQAWYELTDAFAGGRFVVWQSTTGLQGELTVYGSGRPIISSERGALIRDTSVSSSPATSSTSMLDQETETARAEATLREFFQAWAAKDATAWKALLSESRRKDMNIGDWTFADLDRVEFGVVVAAPEGIHSYMTYGRGSTGGVNRDHVRCFRATIAWYHKPGVVGPNDSGQELPWMWFLVRDGDGNWRVDDWGV